MAQEKWVVRAYKNGECTVCYESGYRKLEDVVTRIWCMANLPGVVRGELLADADFICVQPLGDNTVVERLRQLAQAAGLKRQRVAPQSCE